MLIVEDDLTSASALSIILDHRGFEVVRAESVHEGLELLETRPEWVILDLMLPDGGGEAILAEIRMTGQKTRVVVTTGASDPERIRALDRLDPDVVLPKPIDLAQLLLILSPRE